LVSKYFIPLIKPKQVRYGIDYFDCNALGVASLILSMVERRDRGRCGVPMMGNGRDE
jgi:hypothetical protein